MSQARSPRARQPSGARAGPRRLPVPPLAPRPRAAGTTPSKPALATPSSQTQQPPPPTNPYHLPSPSPLPKIQPPKTPCQVLGLVRDVLGESVSIRLHLNPRMDLGEMPLKSFYRQGGFLGLGVEGLGCGVEGARRGQGERAGAGRGARGRAPGVLLSVSCMPLPLILGVPSPSPLPPSTHAPTHLPTHPPTPLAPPGTRSPSSRAARTAR
jgi:hypothetical protein